MDHPAIPQTPSTPLVSFDADQKTLRIVGESFPENSFSFYAPVIAWMKDYLQQHDALLLDLSITYMNSSSTKCMLDLMDLMEEAFGKGVKSAIIWRYDQENPRSCELAEEFSEEVTFPFQIMAFN